MLSIAFGQSKYYVDNLSENVRRGNRQKLRRGEWPSKAPYGYLNNRQTKTIEIDPETSKIVKKAFELFAEGHRSFTEISQFMFSKGTKRLSGKSLHVNQISAMLVNKFYIGILKYADEYYDASHACFIDKPLFDRVQRQVARINRPRYKGHDFAFASLATCGECGATITAEQHIKKYNGKRFVYYRCTKKLKPCRQLYLSECEFTEQTRAIVASCSLHEDWEPIFEQWAEKKLIEDKLTSEAETQNLESRVSDADQKLNRLLDAYLDRVIEPEIYKQKKNELFEENSKFKKN